MLATFWQGALHTISSSQSVDSFSLNCGMSRFDPLLISSFFSGGLTIMIGVRKEDTVYCPLPLYHRLNHHDIKISRFHPCLDQKNEPWPLFQCGRNDQLEWLHGRRYHHGHQVRFSANIILLFQEYDLYIIVHNFMAKVIMSPFLRI